MTPSIPRPSGLALDTASWTQTPLVVCQLIVQLLAVIQQQTARIAALEVDRSSTPATPIVPPLPIHRL